MCWELVHLLLIVGAENDQLQQLQGLHDLHLSNDIRVLSINGPKQMVQIRFCPAKMEDFQATSWTLASLGQSDMGEFSVSNKIRGFPHWKPSIEWKFTDRSFHAMRKTWGLSNLDPIADHGQYSANPTQLSHLK